MKVLIKSQFLRFVVVGGFAAVVNIVSRYGLNHFMGYKAAVAIAYLFGTVTAFILSKMFVFDRAARRGAHKQFVRFAIVNVFAAAQVWLISVGLAEYAFPALGFTYHPYDVAHLIGVIFPVFTSFLGHKYYSFRTTTI